MHIRSAHTDRGPHSYEKIMVLIVATTFAWWPVCKANQTVKANQSEKYVGELRQTSDNAINALICYLSFNHCNWPIVSLLPVETFSNSLTFLIDLHHLHTASSTSMLFNSWKWKSPTLFIRQEFELNIYKHGIELDLKFHQSLYF